MKIINHLYDDKKYIHLCEGSRIHENSPDTYLVWTKCGIDVPAGESFKSDECITCPDCCILIRKGVPTNEGGCKMRDEELKAEALRSAVGLHCSPVANGVAET